MTQTTRFKRIRPLHTWGRGVTAALPPFKREGKGSTPFGPTALALQLSRRRVAQWFRAGLL
jgi:hypothetical protein